MSRAAPAPRATYRLQLGPAFGFRDAAALVPYLDALGVSHVYASPCLQARAGSEHGYDVVDATRVDAARGGEEGFAALCDALAARGMGLLLDVVPNHMAVAGRENPWWWDVLQNGPSSPYAAFFDVDWEDVRAEGGLVVPVLGDHVGRVVEAGELRPVREGGRFEVRYADHAFPVAPRSLEGVLAPAAGRAGSELLAFVARGLGALPAPDATDRASLERRHRDQAVLAGLLSRLLAEEPDSARAVDAELAALAADPARMDGFLGQQVYRLAFWRIAARELPYRRFFDIDQLVALRTEDPRVFAATHRRILEWLEAGRVHGLRVDHVDGLRDPETYLRRLREAAPGAWLLVEKILEADETLPPTWPVDGTTGYEFMAAAGGLFVDPDGAKPLTDLYVSFTGESADYPARLVESKRQVLWDLFGSDLRRLARLFARVCAGHPRHRDHTAPEREEVLVEALARFPVYRSYVRAEAGEAPVEDVRRIDAAVDAARRGRPDLPDDLFALLADVLTLRAPGADEGELAMRFQQLSGPAMAKGAEDTAFYQYNRFVALNEVGGDPRRFGTDPEAFHADCAAAAQRTPLRLLSTSTHDAKRSEDVRARLALLSEIPRRWADAVRRWSGRAERHRRGDLPDRNMELLLYQTLVGAWPLEVERAVAYMEKASREAKQHTSWRSPDPRYDSALRAFVEGVLGDAELCAGIEAFVEPLREPGRANALGQTLLKLTAPGVPDFYQGSELWDLSLVDPDNRRPVDFATRRRLREELEDADPAAALGRGDEGGPKLWLAQRALALRRRRPELFGPGADHTPLPARGSRAAHVVAFARAGGALCVVPRLVLGLGGSWEDTRLPLPPGVWQDLLAAPGAPARSGEPRLAELLADFPVALLERRDGP